jgi:hypothetical protein
VAVSIEAQDAGSPQAKFLLNIVQDLLDSESKRDDAVNARGVAVVALCAVMLTLTATVTGAPLAVGFNRGWRVLAIILVTLAIGTLCVAASTAMLGVLRPRRFAMLATAEVRKFTTAEYLERSDDANRQVLLTGMVEILENERARSAQKATWLRRSYALILIAMISLAVVGAMGGFFATRLV